MAGSTLLKYSLLILCLDAANLPAQTLEMIPPPLPDVWPSPPPDPNRVPPPPPLEWAPLGSLPPLDSTTSPPPFSFVPPAPAAPASPLPVPPPVALFLGGAPNPSSQWLATPQFEIWRTGAETPEAPMPVKEGWRSTLIASGNPIVVRLLFDPSMTGTLVTVSVTEGVLIQPPQEAVYISAGGECLFTVDLDGSQKEGGEISFYTNQVTTGLRLVLATPEMIALMGGGQ